MNDDGYLNIGEHRIKVIRSKRHSMSLRIDNNKNISILCPLSTSARYISSFVEAKQSWIDKAMRKIDNKIDLINIDSEAGYILLNGRKIQLNIEHNDKIVKYEFDGNTLTLFSKTMSNTVLIRLIFLFLRHQLGSLQETFTKYEKLITPQRPVHKVSWRPMRSRWGSYSSMHNISLNIALAMLPKELQELVIVHELCHIQEPNHSRYFYKYLGEYLPNYIELDKELNRYKLNSIFCEN